MNPGTILIVISISYFLSGPAPGGDLSSALLVGGIVTLLLNLISMSGGKEQDNDTARGD